MVVPAGETVCMDAMHVVMHAMHANIALHLHMRHVYVYIYIYIYMHMQAMHVCTAMHV